MKKKERGKVDKSNTYNGFSRNIFIILSDLQISLHSLM